MFGIFNRIKLPHCFLGPQPCCASPVKAKPVSGWQATKNSLKERVSFMCCNDLIADVYFSVGRGDSRKVWPSFVLFFFEETYC